MSIPLNQRPRIGAFYLNQYDDGFFKVLDIVRHPESNWDGLIKGFEHEEHVLLQKSLSPNDFLEHIGTPLTLFRKNFTPAFGAKKP